MASNATVLSPREHLERRIATNLEEAERWRAEHGDPAEALGRYLVERYGIEAIMETYQEFLDHEDSFLYDDFGDNTVEAKGAGEPG